MYLTRIHRGGKDAFHNKRTTCFRLGNYLPLVLQYSCLSCGKGEIENANITIVPGNGKVSFILEGEVPEDKPRSDDLRKLLEQAVPA